MKTCGCIPFTLTTLLALAAPVYGDSIYKWVDDDGVTHFESRLPPKSAEHAQTIELDPDTVRAPISDPGAELQRRLQQYKRYHELLRERRAAELGISLEELDAFEKAGLFD